MQFQPRNLITSKACSIILWTHAVDAMKSLKCVSKLSMGLEKPKFDKTMSVLQKMLVSVRPFGYECTGIIYGKALPSPETLMLFLHNVCIVNAHA